MSKKKKSVAKATKKSDDKLIVIGTPKKDDPTPKRKYRITIQERKTKYAPTEKMRSFMIHDHTGRTTIDSIKKRLELKK